VSGEAAGSAPRSRYAGFASRLKIRLNPPSPFTRPCAGSVKPSDGDTAAERRRYPGMLASRPSGPIEFGEESHAAR